MKEIYKKLKPFLADYLQSQGINPSKMFKCINPLHNEKEPSMKYYENGFMVYCFGCRKAYDLVGVIEIMENLTPEEALNRAIALYMKNEKKATKREKQAAASTTHKDYSKAYEHWRNNLKTNVEAKKYLLNRGISDEIVNRFNIGFNTFKLGETPFKAVTIPITIHSYVARNIVDGEEFKYLRPKNNPVEIFNVQALTNEKPYCVITEGELDALSFETVGINAIALGSANNTEKFFGTNKSQSKTYILALDNDDRGRQARIELEQYLNDNGIKYISFDCCGEKDPNACLVKDKQQFEKSIKEIVKTAIESGSEL